MALPLIAIVPQSISAIYPPLKDLFLYLKGKKRYVEHLEENLSELITDLISIKSRKEIIDKSLKTHVTKENNDEYLMAEKHISILHKEYTKFKAKYEEMTSDLPHAASELDFSSVSRIIEELDERKPTRILTTKFFKLAKLSKDIKNLDRRAKKVHAKLQPNDMMREKEPELSQQALDDDRYLPGVRRYCDDVLKYLSGNGRRSIGITGPAGIGKTTVLRKLYNHVIVNKSLSAAAVEGENSLGLDLDTFIFVSYGQELKNDERIVEKLQNEIMLKLNIHQGRGIDQNADLISAFLCEKKYIFLMDNVSQSIDLNVLGLRRGHAYGKIVIASHDKKEKIEIQKLGEDDSWKLFKNNCGKIHSKRIERIARMISECCGGLPLEIKAVATYVRDKKEESFWNGVMQLFTGDVELIKMVGLGGIYNFYKKLYEELESRSQKCLLYGALFPNEIYKDYLVECWMAEGFIDQNDIQKLRRTRDIGQTIFEHFVDIFLLEWCCDKKNVKMSPNFRMVALTEKYPDEENLATWVSVDAGEPDTETWSTTKRMSLIKCKSKLPASPKCTSISTLLLGSNPYLERIEYGFFVHMHSLRVLDLQNNTQIRALPGSIHFLCNLRCLNLKDCLSISILPPEAAKLTELEFLDICGTSIPSLPQEVEHMVNLRCLRASFPIGMCTKVIIPLEIIPKLSKLEELSIDADFHCQCTISFPDIDKLAMEMAGLEYLTTLHFKFPNVTSLDEFVSNSKSLKNTTGNWKESTFRSFKISVGRQQPQHPYGSDFSEIVTERRLIFSEKQEFSSGCKQVLEQANAFELINHHGVKNLNEFNLDSIEVCVVERCNHLTNIVDCNTIAKMDDNNIVEESDSIIALENIEKLHLYELESLQCIWEGPILHGNLLRLTVLTLNGCPKLAKVLDLELARALTNLKHLKVENCSQVSKILDVQEKVDLSDILNNVEIVQLSNLPALQSICKSTSLKWNSLKAMAIIRCNKLSDLSLSETNAKMLSSIECEDIWWTSLELTKEIRDRLRRFCRIKQALLTHDDSVIARARLTAQHFRPREEMSTQADSSRPNGNNSIHNNVTISNSDPQEDGKMPHHNNFSGCSDPQAACSRPNREISIRRDLPITSNVDA
ncbi:hypothetical protein ABFS83_07G095400 [Erythranthe nasuta]